MKASLLVLALIASPAMAATGYKEMKFGMSVEETLKHRPCTLTIAPADLPNVERYYCDDLVYAGERTQGNAFFIGGKFLRFAIGVSEGRAVGALQTLYRKYGKASRAPTQSETSMVGKVPGSQWITAFDSNSILVLFYTTPTLNVEPYVVYTSPNYEVRLVEAESKGLESEL